MRAIDLTGQRFNKLTAISPTRTPSGRLAWIVRCDCGNERAYKAGDLRTGKPKSCGCDTARIISEMKWRHGHATCRNRTSPTYRTWTCMVQRCNRPSFDAYPWYGGRGIRVCERWLVFANFLTDMGERPDGKTLDRIDRDGDYELSNCRWATPKEQAANRCAYGTGKGLARR